MDENRVTVGQFVMPHDAHLAQMELEDNGITAHIRDEYTILADSLISHAIGGVRVEVAESDAERARELLEASVTPERLRVTCPQCESKDTARKEHPRLPAILAMILRPIFTLLFLNSWRCNSCDAKFNVRLFEEKK